MTSHEDGEQTGQVGETGGAVANPDRVRLPVANARRSGKKARLDTMIAEWDAVHEKGSE